MLLIWFNAYFSGCPRRHDGGDLQQDENVDLGTTGTEYLGTVEGAALTWSSQYYMDAATDARPARVQESAAVIELYEMWIGIVRKAPIERRWYVSLNYIKHGIDELW